MLVWGIDVLPTVVVACPLSAIAGEMATVAIVKIDDAFMIIQEELLVSSARLLEAVGLGKI